VCDRWDVQDIFTAGSKDIAPSAAAEAAKETMAAAEQVCGWPSPVELFPIRSQTYDENTVQPRDFFIISG
jgi:hypothetical protein